jgi:hypothetical protein
MGPAFVISGDGGGYLVTMSYLGKPGAARPRHHSSSSSSVGARGHYSAPSSSSAAAAAASSSAPSALLPSSPLALLPAYFTRGGTSGGGWGTLVTAAFVGANALALLYLARRAYDGYCEAAAARLERAAQEERHKAEQQEVMRTALAYLQRLWDVAVHVSFLCFGGF